MDFEQELKYEDDSETGTEVATDTVKVYLLNDVGAGDTETTRNGRIIDCHAVRLQARWKTNAGHTVPSTCRMFIVADSMNNSNFISNQADADSWIVNVLKTNDPLSLINMNTTNRFLFLYDVIFTVAASEQNSNSFQVFDETIVFDEPVRTLYSGTSGTGGSISSNAIYLVAMSDAATTVGPDFKFNSRLRFTE